MAGFRGFRRAFLYVAETVMIGGLIFMWVVFIVVFAVYDIKHRDPDECGFFRE